MLTQKVCVLPKWVRAGQERIASNAARLQIPPRTAVAPRQHACLGLLSTRSFAMATSEATRAPAVRDNGARVESRARRLITETKAAFKTTEFWAMLGLIVSILVAA